MSESLQDRVVKIKVIDSKVLDSCCIRVKKAYPAYFDSYKGVVLLIKVVDGVIKVKDKCLFAMDRYVYNRNGGKERVTAKGCGFLWEGDKDILN